MRRTAVAVAAVLLLAGCGNNSNDHAGSASSKQMTVNGAEPAKDVQAANGPAAVGDAVPLSRSVIRTATLTVRVDDVDGARRSAVTVAERAGGYLESERSTLDTGTTVTLRVPPESFTATLDAVARLGTVASRDVSTEDVTGDVADVEGRLAAARTSTARLRGLLDKATSVTEIAALESELSERESELESLSSRQRALHERTTLATVTVTFDRRGTVAAAPKVDAKGFLGGLRGGWFAFTGAVVVVLVVVGALLPFAAAGAVVGVPLYLWRRRRRVSGAHV